MPSTPHRVAIVGGGFGGLKAAHSLRRAPVEVTLVDRRNFHLFQPLTYQVATGALSPAEVAAPLRAIFQRARNVNVVLAEVAAFDLDGRVLHLQAVEERLPRPEPVPYDTLIVAGGSQYSYFGHEEWRHMAIEVKSLESAIEARGRILTAFEAADAEEDPDRRAAWLTFVVVGAGPTGVEIAGQIGELARDTLHREFSRANPRSARVLLVEALDRVLTSFPPSLSKRAERSLARIGVEPLLGKTVVAVEDGGVSIESSGTTERIPARTVIWAAGVTASPLAGTLASLSGGELDKAGRLTVGSDLTLPGHPEVFAIGDMVRVRGHDGSVRTLPGVAPVAIQEGQYAARAIRARLRGRDAGPFHYHDKGNLATIGRAAAVADIKGLKLSGALAWFVWLGVHLWYLVGFQNRLFVFFRWSISFFTHGRGARLITHEAGEEPGAGDASRAEAEVAARRPSAAPSGSVGK